MFIEGILFHWIEIAMENKWKCQNVMTTKMNHFEMILQQNFAHEQKKSIFEIMLLAFHSYEIHMSIYFVCFRECLSSIVQSIQIQHFSCHWMTAQNIFLLLHCVKIVRIVCVNIEDARIFCVFQGALNCWLLAQTNWAK